MNDIAAAVNATLGIAQFKPGVTRKTIQSVTINTRGEFVTFTDGTQHDVTEWEDTEAVVPGGIMIFSPTGESLVAPESFLDFLE